MDWRKLATLVFIHVFVLIQLVVPQCYYVTREDENDERFAWRMFSPTRMLRCDGRFYADGERVRLFDHFHEAWPRLVRRGRMAVIEGMALALCEKGHEDVRVHLVCKPLGGEKETIAAGTWNVCSVGGV